MSTGTVSGVTLFPLGVCRYGSCTAGLKMFPGDGAHIDQMPQRPHPGPRDRGIGVFATFLKTCGILLVIILCLQFILVLSILHLFSWNMLSSFQLNVQISSLMEGFLPLKHCICVPLWGSLPPVLRWVFSALTSTNLSAFLICFHFHLHGEPFRSFFFCYIRLISSHF